MRKSGGILTSVCLVAGLVFSTTLEAAPPDPVAEPRRSVKADNDHDKLFDDLEDHLAELGDNDDVSVIVTLTAPATPAILAQLEQRVGDLAVSHRFSLIDAFAMRVPKAVAVALARLPIVDHVEEDSLVFATNQSAQDSFGVTAARAQAPGLDGDGDSNPAAYTPSDLVAAVIDTGIDPGHVDLDQGKVIFFKDWVNNRTVAYDDNGHGTHVAGTIAGTGEGSVNGRGVAPAAGLIGLKVLDAAGSGTMANVTAAIDWAVANRTTYGIEVINLSLGTSGCANGTDATSVAVNNAAAAGIVVAVAAGNAGPGTCTVGSPGAAREALTVGAMADLGANGFKQAYFSSRGSSTTWIKPEISAPGVNITSADNGTANGYVVFSGTSMATPFVAGVALLMRDANAALSPADVKGKIMGTAVDWGPAGTEVDYGAGRLDAYAALASAGAALTTPPAVPVHESRSGTLAGTGAQIDYVVNVTNTAFPIAATLIHTGISAGTASSPDFDVYLLNPSGTQVAAAETNRRQDEIGFTPTVTGAYTVRVKSFNGSGAFVLDISAGLGADTTAPTVSSVAPANGATGVAATTAVSVTFNEAMNQAATHGAFSLTPAGGSPVAGAFSWSGTTMTFTPSAPLASSTSHAAIVTTAASDSAGNPLAVAQTWSFTTAAPAATVTASPSSTTIQTGTLRSGSAANLAANDNAFFEVNSNTTSTRTIAWYGTVGGVANTLTSLRVSYSGRNSRSCTQTVALWRWTDSTWVQLDSRAVGTTEVTITALAATGALADYVSGVTGNGEVRVRIRCRTTGGTFFASGDLLSITYIA